MLTDDILKLIGHTPLLKLGGTNIYAKLEYFNPLHSVKDRAALYMIEGAIGRGELAPGGTVVEATSGNTGIGLAAVAARKGLRLITVLPENMSEERKKLLRHLGAEVIETPADQGMAGSVRRANELAAELGAFVPDQFSNHDCITAHIETTAQEIVADLGDIVPDYLVLTFGSAGTLTGVSRSLKKVYPNIKCIAVEPKESPLLSKGIAGKHGIQGIGANFIPSLLDRSLIDEVMTVGTDEAYAAARYAAKRYATLVGISSGAALVAAQRVQDMNPDANIITLFPDTGERYLSVW